MTIKKRLFWSNILMILVPAAVTGLVGAVCMGAVWLALTGGLGLGVHDREELELTGAALCEQVEHQLAQGAALSTLEPLLEGNALALRVSTADGTVYTYGETAADDALRAAAALLDGDGATVSQNGRALYARRITAAGVEYTVCLSGACEQPRTAAGLKTAAKAACAVIALAVVLSILLTNRFLTRGVLHSIEEPLLLLSGGVRELRDGNLDYRLSYTRADEFRPVCEDFNEMAGRLKDSVTRLQQQEQSRRELIAGISHDIRSPLTSICAYVEGLQDGVARTPEARSRYLSIIRSKAEDLEHMVSRLFLFSKMELGDFPENPCALRLDEAVETAVAAAAEETRRAGLEVEMQLCPAVVQADPLQVRRIVTNILENSIKYKEKEHGRVRISLRRTEAGLLLCFADDGPGVEPEALPHLFEVFYRSDPARRNPHQGSGLGLAIVANAVRRMGGRIAARPSAMGGLEICIELPEK